MTLTAVFNKLSLVKIGDILYIVLSIFIIFSLTCNSNLFTSFSCKKKTNTTFKVLAERFPQPINVELGF